MNCHFAAGDECVTQARPPGAFARALAEASRRLVIHLTRRAAATPTPSLMRQSAGRGDDVQGGASSGVSPHKHARTHTNTQRSHAAQSKQANTRHSPSKTASGSAFPRERWTTAVVAPSASTWRSTPYRTPLSGPARRRDREERADIRARTHARCERAGGPEKPRRDKASAGEAEASHVSACNFSSKCIARAGVVVGGEHHPRLPRERLRRPRERPAHLLHAAVPPLDKEEEVRVRGPVREHLGQSARFIWVEGCGERW